MTKVLEIAKLQPHVSQSVKAGSFGILPKIKRYTVMLESFYLQSTFEAARGRYTCSA